METAQVPPPQPQGDKPRYGALRTIAKILRILAFIVAIVGGIGVLIAAAVTAGESGGAALLTLIGGALYVGFFTLVLFAYAELIRLLIDAESNTRRTAEALERRGL